MTYRRTFDNDYEFLAPNGFISHCHLQIYRAEGRPMLVVASELPSNPGMSVTNAAETLATDVFRAFRGCLESIESNFYVFRLQK
jgi:hypothetical protein